MYMDPEFFKGGGVCHDSGGVICPSLIFDIWICKFSMFQGRQNRGGRGSSLIKCELRYLDTNYMTSIVSKQTLSS